MVQGKWFAPGDDLSSSVLPVRLAVFGRGADPLDSESWNVLVYQNATPVATGRIWWSEGAFWLGDLAVLEAFRGRKLGDLVLRLLLFKAQSHSAKEVRLRCPENLTGFFARLGLKPEKHGMNELVEMSVRGDQINLDSCSSCPRENCPSRRL